MRRLVMVSAMTTSLCKRTDQDTTHDLTIALTTFSPFANIRNDAACSSHNEKGCTNAPPQNNLVLPMLATTVAEQDSHMPMGLSSSLPVLA